MSDYTKTTNFTAKDSLATGDANKLITGAGFDTEFDAIAVAVNTKYDVTNLSTQLQAETLTSDAVLITPHSLNDVLVDNGGILKDLQQLAAPGADNLLAYDFGTTAAKGFTLGAGLEFSGDTINLKDAVAGTGLAIASSIMSVGVSDGIQATANGILLNVGALTAIASNELDGADGFCLYDDSAGVHKKMVHTDFGMKVNLAQTAQTFGDTSLNSIFEVNDAQTLTIPTNASQPLNIGGTIKIVNDNASTKVTITAAASVTLNSVFHAGGAVAASDTVDPGGTAWLTKIANDEWYLSGDISDT